MLVAIRKTCVCYRRQREDMLPVETEVAMSLERIRIRNRSVFPGVGLLSLCVALAGGFIAATWRGETGLPVAEKQLAIPTVRLAICICPDPADAPQGHP